MATTDTDCLQNAGHGRAEEAGLNMTRERIRLSRRAVEVQIRAAGGSVKAEERRVVRWVLGESRARRCPIIEAGLGLETEWDLTGDRIGGTAAAIGLMAAHIWRNWGEAPVPKAPLNRTEWGGWRLPARVLGHILVWWRRPDLPVTLDLAGWPGEVTFRENTPEGPTVATVYERAPDRIWEAVTNTEGDGLCGIGVAEHLPRHDPRWAEPYLQTTCEICLLQNGHDPVGIEDPAGPERAGGDPSRSGRSDPQREGSDDPASIDAPHR
jgi:hypothetical protein